MTEQRQWESLEVEIADRVATVSIAGPSKGNTLIPAFWEEMPALFAQLGRDDQVRAIIVRGRGEQFTYGLDLKRNAPMFMGLMQQENKARERMELRDTVKRWQDSCTCMERCPKPVIAAIDGWCIGGGINLIAAADWRLASRQARFSLREVRIAITADLGALQRLPSIIGEGATRRIAMTGEDFDAEYAERIGLVEGVYEDAEALYAAAREQAEQVANNPSVVLRSIKEVLNHGRDASLEQGLDYIATWNSAFLESRDLQEAFMSFMEQREPDYD